jgi:hypothetical protein
MEEIYLMWLVVIVFIRQLWTGCVVCGYDWEKKNELNVCRSEGLKGNFAMGE